jgi:RNA polymerase sigma-70 factor (ECF subfamily)
MTAKDYSNLDDETLVRLVAMREMEAFQELYARYNGFVFGLVMRMVGDAGAAEEIAQDVFYRLWERAQTYRIEQAKVKTWLLSIARHRAIDRLRRRKVRPEQTSVSLDTDIFHLEDGSNVELDVDNRLRRDRIVAALDGLPVEQRQVIVLAYFFGYSQSQIAEREGQPIGTVKTRTRLAMQKLKVALGTKE